MKNDTINELLKTYNCQSANEIKSALREIIQQIVLIGLSKTDFFEHASFYGGTALRIFYGLKRFSEDLGFTLVRLNDHFSLTTYLPSIKEVFKSYGLDVDVSLKEKVFKTPIESAFAKVNTYETVLSLKIDNIEAKSIHKDEVLKVKIEVDCDPPLGFNNQIKWITIPEFAKVKVLDLPSLFAGKIHALLCRTYKNNVKGRDYYDFLFYIARGVSPNLNYLKNKLVESGKIKEDMEFNLLLLKEMLHERMKQVNFDQVIDDAKKFIFDNEDISYYCKELFDEMIDKIN